MTGLPMTGQRGLGNGLILAVSVGLALAGVAGGCSRSPVQRAESLARSLGGRALFDGERLFRLELQRSRVRDSDLPKFLAWVPHLEEIDVSATKVTDEGIRAIAAMPRLRKVSVSGVKISKAAVEHLAALQELTDLYLVATPLSDDAIEALAKLTSLRRLSVSGSKLSEEGVERLRQSLPGTAITAESLVSRSPAGTARPSREGS